MDRFFIKAWQLESLGDVIDLWITKPTKIQSRYQNMVFDIGGSKFDIEW